MIPAVRTPQPRSRSSKPLTMAERMERLEGDVAQQREQLQHFTNYQYSCNITLGEMMRQLVVGMAVDMTEFPTMPGYPEQMLATEVPSSSQAEGAGGDGVTAEGNEEEL